MAKVRLLAHSYERYAEPGDRSSLVEHRHGDIFDVDGQELDRLQDLQAVEPVRGGERADTLKRAKAEHELAVKRHDQAKAEHEALAGQSDMADEVVERSAMNVEALRGERERLGRLANRDTP